MQSGTYESFTRADLRKPIRQMLVTSGYVPNFEKHVNVMDIAPFLVTFGGKEGARMLADQEYDGEVLRAGPSVFDRPDQPVRAVVLTMTNGRLIACIDLGREIKIDDPELCLTIDWKQGIVLRAG